MSAPARTAAVGEAMTVLRADAPAASWLERYPLGDGGLGAMCDGDAPARFSLNDDTAWSGSPASEDRPDPQAAQAALATARAAIASGDPVTAETRLRALQSRYTQAYQPFADLTVRAEGATRAPGRYRRELDLLRGVHTVVAGDVTETSFVTGHVLVHVVTAPSVEAELTTPLRELGRPDEPGGRALLLRLPDDVAPGHEPDLPAARWSERPGAALEGAVVARVLPADEQGRTVVLTATATTYTRLGSPPSGDRLTALARARAAVDAAAAHGIDALLERHVAEHRAVMERTLLELPAAPGDDQPTARRLSAALASGTHPLAHDPGLAALLFTYGRYLLWSSSRPGTLPATLQGIWNDELRPPWSCNYTTNINVQMAYWSAGVTDLAEAAQPLADLVDALAVGGARTASELYGLGGWVAHHNSDAWAFTGVPGRGRGDARWAQWTLGGVWLAAQLWDLARFGLVSDDQARRRWPALRGAAEFGLGWLRADEHGWTTSPATSPENAYLTPTDGPAAVDRVTAADLSILRELFTAVVEAAARLGLTDDLVAAACAERLDRLPAAPAISPDGTVVEWAEPRTEEDPYHRHLSPLVGLYPGAGDWDGPHRRAADATLVRRGDDSSGWSLVWKIALWARLHRGDKVSDLLRLLIRRAQDTTGPWAGGLHPNLFTSHPPFQLDANLGYVAALAECLVQSHGGIELLPALPSELPTGRVSGIVARPGVRVDVSWADHRLCTASLRTVGDAPVTVRIGWRGSWLTRTIDPGGTSRLTADDFIPGRGPGERTNEA